MAQKTTSAKKENGVKNKIAIVFLLAVCLFCVPGIFAQGMGEYGRTLGGVGNRAGTPGSPAPFGGHGSAGQSNGPVIEGRGVRLPSQLAVSSNEATLYSRSEDWADKITSLTEGQRLRPLGQTFSAGTTWFMVRAEDGIVGWVKSSDVRDGSKQ